MMIVLFDRGRTHLVPPLGLTEPTGICNEVTHLSQRGRETILPSSHPFFPLSLLSSFWFLGCIVSKLKEPLVDTITIYL